MSDDSKKLEPPPPHVQRILDDQAAREKSQAGKKTEFEVGFCKPPKHSRFQKGAPSANPKGRPRRDKALQEMIKEALHKPVSVTLNGKRVRKSMGELTLNQIARQSAAGNLRAGKMAVDLMREISPLKPEEQFDPELEAKRKEISGRLVDLLEWAAAEKKGERRVIPPGGFSEDREKDNDKP